MRAREFTINIPINIKINGDGEPEVSTDQDDENHDNGTVKTMVPPLQQKLDIMKKLAGIDSDGEEAACEECGCSPCECDDHEDEMSIMKRNAGLAPITIAIADENEPWEG